MSLKILGIDSSAKSASAAITEDGKIISSFYMNTGLTHSQTLMPIIDSVLKYASLTCGDIDLYAVNNGPGSFTGVRIGVAAVKGIADVAQKPCMAVSTLESMAYNLLGVDGIACAVMDARCNQVYTALFEINSSNVTRLTDDTAISIDELKNILFSYKKNKILVGDGADLCYNTFGKDDDSIALASEALKYQNSVSVCLAAASADESRYIKSDELQPSYLRLPQAQRELKAKLNRKN